MTTQPTTKSSREADKFVVRLPDGMRDGIAAQAGTNGRSMNSEIINRLERSLIQDQVNAEQTKMISILLARIDELEGQLQPLQGAA